MKEVSLKNGKTIKTPWLRIEEAAAYCGLSSSAFTDHARDLPHGGNSRTRIYNTKILDAWLDGTLDIPFNPDALPKRPLRRSYIKPDTSLGLVDPNDGQVFKTREIIK